MAEENASSSPETLVVAEETCSRCRLVLLLLGASNHLISLSQSDTAAL